jgi:hypothetical protein
MCLKLCVTLCPYIFRSIVYGIQYIVIRTHAVSTIAQTFHIDRPAIPNNIARHFNGAGKFKYMGCDSTEHGGERPEQRP